MRRLGLACCERFLGAFYIRSCLLSLAWNLPPFLRGVSPPPPRCQNYQFGKTQQVLETLVGNIIYLQQHDCLKLPYIVYLGQNVD